MARRWIPERHERPTRRDIREQARGRLSMAASFGPVPERGIRIAVNSGVPVAEVAAVTGKTFEQVQRICDRIGE